MNKQQLIDKFEKRKTIIGNFQGYAVWWEDVKEIFEQLDEPQPIKIPQCVADVIEDAREKSPELEDALHYTWGNGTKEFTEWYNKKFNRDLFARAWLDGYEVEEEKRYLVKVKGVYHGNLGYAETFNGYSFYNKDRNLSGLKYKHTRKQLEEAGFGWVFDCEGVEIEEVE